MSLRRTILSAAMVASVLVVSGCGSDNNSSIDAEERLPPPPAPPLSQIEESMWDAMGDAESVSISVDFVEDDEVFLTEEYAALEEVFGEGFGGIGIIGAVDGSGTELLVGPEDRRVEVMRIFEDEAYLSAEFIAADAFGQPEPSFDEDETEEDSFVDISGNYAGYWFDESADYDGELDEYTIAELFAAAEESWFDDEAELASPISDPSLYGVGEHQRRYGMDVWVYPGEEGAELVVEADQDAPRMLRASNGMTIFSFTQWGRTPEVKVPLDLLTEEEFEEIAYEAMDE